MATITRLGLHGTPTRLWPFQAEAASGETPIASGRVSVTSDDTGRVSSEGDDTGRVSVDSDLTGRVE